MDEYTTTEEIKEWLCELARRLAKIEDRNPEFAKSVKWNLYRKKQDELYDELRRRQCLSNQQDKNDTPTELLESSEVNKANDLLQLCRSTKNKTEDLSTQM